ncbi:MAG: 1-acyl-sn-glycerol-3-phosphate acyltransferase [Rhodocyclaceae bacterium]|nr:1-acyl-sn-glycerol-3-phosphate acyltransferase [Rhodocyclaceae bacterium]MCA3146430.1 1-acyl-sn-glycerol-3-phosphate acyltransferase [Rhodocyclaceae bacterium]
MLRLRCTVFAAAQVALTVVWALLSLLTAPLPPLGRYRVITAWSRMVLWLVEHVCGVRYRVIGGENIPAGPCVVLAKHQSAWETLAFQRIFPPQVWVLKRELLKVPFFGWGLAMLRPIAIDRGAGRAALTQLVEQGRDRLDLGLWIVIFPEGTRTAPGARGTWHTGGAWLATKTGAPVVPVAHNAGTVWPRNAFLKHPGTITVSIGPAIDPTGLKAEALNRRVSQWVEEEAARLGSARQDS